VTSVVFVGSKTVGDEKPLGVPGFSAASTCTVTVKLVPVTLNSLPISPLLVLAVGAEFATLTMDPAPLVSVSTNLVFTARFVAEILS